MGCRITPTFIFFFAKFVFNAFRVSWATGSGYLVKVKRLSSRYTLQFSVFIVFITPNCFHIMHNIQIFATLT